MIAVIILLVIVLLIGGGMYNSLVGKRNEVNNAFSTIDVMVKKRFDLIPNLVETVKRYTQYEGDTLSRITALRSQAVSGEVSDGEKLQLDQQVGTAVRGLMLSVERYPELKANENFLNLQAVWTESEEQIAAARRNYNACVTVYNNGVMMFPGNLFAGMLNYQPMPVLAATEEERKNINAKQLFD